MIAPILVALSVAAAPAGEGVTLPSPLTLDAALRVARANQPGLLQARANAEVAAARADLARAPLLPQVSGNAFYQRGTANFVERPGSTPTTGVRRGTSWSTSDFFSFGATASQLVYDFGQTTGRWRAARASADAASSSERATAQDVVLTVESAFFAARAAKDLVGVQRETLANQEAHLQQIEAFVRSGTRPEIDLAQARTDRANARVAFINAENGYATARAQLNQAMGVDAPAEYEVASDQLPALDGEDAAPEVLLDEALRSRPDLASFDQQIRAQELTIGAAKGGYAPSLGVATSISDAGPSLDQTVPNWNATATLTWNLYQGGATRAQVREATAALDAVRAEASAARQQVRLDVEEARLSVHAARAAVDAAGDAVVNARERLRLAEGRYRAGVGNVIELGDAQVALTAAESQRVQAEYNLSTSRARLLRALGRAPVVE